MIIHGVSGRWDQGLPLLEILKVRHKVILVSRPGYGGTPLRTGVSYTGQARAYSELLKALSVPKASIFGISGGGPSTLAFAIHHPEQCASLALAVAVASHLTREAPGEWAAAIPGVPTLYCRIGRGAQGRALQDPLNAYHYFDRAIAKGERERVRSDPEIAGDFNDLVARSYRGALGAAGLKNDILSTRRARRRGIAQDAGAVLCPALILHGDDDAIVDIRQAKYHAQAIPNAKLIVYPGGGHMLPLTFKTELMADYEAFLSRLE
jgi:pimeloyl-ACP methyl ester carboxylesterase